MLNNACCGGHLDMLAIQPILQIITQWLLLRIFPIFFFISHCDFSWWLFQKRVLRSKLYYVFILCLYGNFVEQVNKKILCFICRVHLIIYLRFVVNITTVVENGDVTSCRIILYQTCQFIIMQKHILECQIPPLIIKCSYLIMRCLFDRATAQFNGCSRASPLTVIYKGLLVMVSNATFNNISAISWR